MKTSTSAAFTEMGYRAIRSPVMVPIQISLPTCSAAVELENRSVAT